MLEVRILSGTRLASDIASTSRSKRTASGTVSEIPESMSSVPLAGPERNMARRVKIQGAIAQLVERLRCIQEVVGSIPTGST